MIVPQEDGIKREIYEVDKMENTRQITELWIMCGGVVVVSALIFVILSLIARASPESVLAKPHAVRDVWLVANGVLFGVIFATLNWFVLTRYIL